MGTLAAHETNKSPQRRQIGSDADLAPERRQDHQLRQRPPVEGEVVALARALLPGDQQGLVTSAIEALGEEGRVERRATDVQAADDAQDADAVAHRRPGGSTGHGSSMCIRCHSSSTSKLHNGAW